MVVEGGGGDYGPIASPVALNGQTVTTSATAGAATALPPTPEGYLTVSINGTARKVPYYS